MPFEQIGSHTMILTLTRSSSETRNQGAISGIWEDSRPGGQDLYTPAMDMSQRPSHVGILAMEVYLPGQKVWATGLQCSGLGGLRAEWGWKIRCCQPHWPSC